MHEKIFNCQVTGVTFLESRRRRLRRTCDERRLREKNIARNPWKLPRRRLTHDGKALNLIAPPHSVKLYFDSERKKERNIDKSHFDSLLPARLSEIFNVYHTAAKIRRYVLHSGEQESNEEVYLFFNWTGYRSRFRFSFVRSFLYIGELSASVIHFMFRRRTGLQRGYFTNDAGRSKCGYRLLFLRARTNRRRR